MLIYAIKIWISTEARSQFCITHKLHDEICLRVSIQLHSLAKLQLSTSVWLPQAPLPITKAEQRLILV